MARRMRDDEAALYEASQKFPNANLVVLAVELGIGQQRAEYLVKKLARTNKHLRADEMIDYFRRHEGEAVQLPVADECEPDCLGCRIEAEELPGVEDSDDIDTELYEED